jgi:hypothetical protein
MCIIIGCTVFSDRYSVSVALASGRFLSIFIVTNGDTKPSHGYFATGTLICGAYSGIEMIDCWDF